MTNKSKDALDEDEFKNALAALVADAENYIEETLAPERIASQKLYDSEHYGDEIPGRSHVHSSDVRDSILSKMPSFMRALAGAQNICDVIPRDETEVEQCAEMADTIDYYWTIKNDGFQTLYSAVHDGELKKAGFITWWHEVKERVIPAIYRGFTQEMIDMFLAQDDVELVSKEVEDNDDQTPNSLQADPNHSAPDPSMMMAAMRGPKGAEGMDDDTGGEDADEQTDDDASNDPLKTYTIHVLRTVKDKEFRIASVPPEEMIISRDARNERDNSIIGRRREMTVGELVSLGYDLDDILENGGTEASSPNNVMFDQEMQARVPSLMNTTAQPSSDPLLRKVAYYEVYHRVSKDGAHNPLRRTCLLGHGHYVLFDEVYEDQDTAPFAILCGNPIPHAAIGLSCTDQVAELQVLKTKILRNTMDSLANSIWPKTAFDSTKVNVDDLMSSEAGALVRVIGQPAASIQEMNSSFIGPQSLQVLQYIDDTKQKRLGVGDGTSLKGDELQSTTAVAAAAIVGQGQDRLELETRHYADGLKKVFKGLLRLIIRNAEGPLPIRTRDGTFRQVDPRMWNPDADVRIATALGKGSEQQKVQLLQNVLQIQQQLFQNAGLNQPLVGMMELRNVIEDLCIAMNYPSVGRYFKKVDPNWAPPPPPKQLDPMTLNAQATALQAQVAAKKAEGEHMIALEKARNDATQAAAQMAQDRYLKELELKYRYGAQINEAGINMAIERERMQRDQEVASALGMAEIDHKNQQANLDRSADMMNSAIAGMGGATAPAPQQPGAPNVTVNASAPPPQPGQGPRPTPPSPQGR